MNPIYEPKGAAKEYGDLAINIYTGCPHACWYCYAPAVLRRDKEVFQGNVRPRENIVEEVCKQLQRGNIQDKLIHLCFTCDPYPTGCDSMVTREVIKAIKDSGNHVQILTKGDGTRDLDLLDENDWYGITYTGYPIETLSDSVPPPGEPGSMPLLRRLKSLRVAHDKGIKTWVSVEPALDVVDVLNFLELRPAYIDKWTFGKLNHHRSDVDWSDFGTRVERACISNKLNYVIKDSLRKEINKRIDRI